MSAEPVPAAEPVAAPVRIGVVATDPIRVLGLQAIFSAEEGLVPAWGGGRAFTAEIVPLSVPGVLQDAELCIVMIDASCTDHMLELLATFRKVRPSIRLIVIGQSEEPSYIQEMIGAGARGYVSQEATENEIRQAVGIVKDGSVWAPRKVLSRLLDASVPTGDIRPGEAIFTTREIEVLRLLVTGLSNREIADGLNIDEGTVKAHLTRLMRKVGAKNRIELTLRALREPFGPSEL